MHFAFNNEQDPIEHIALVVHQIILWIELLLHQICQIRYDFLVYFGESLFGSIRVINFKVEIKEIPILIEMSFEDQISEQLLAEGGPLVTVVLHFLFQDLLEGHIVGAQNIVVLSAKNL